jgi:hypothetical protein
MRKGVSMPEHIDVFLSSTSRDLKKYRDRLRDVILNAGAFPIAMEEFDAGSANALQKCHDEVSRAEIFIGVYAHRYGFAPGAHMTWTTRDGEVRAGDGVTSITEWEYRWARERRLPMLLYVVADEDEDGEPLPWVAQYIDGEPERSRLMAFKQAIMTEHVVGFFRSPDDLGRQVAGALPKVIARLEGGDRPLISGRRDFYRHISLPVNFVARPELLDAMRAALLAHPAGIALHGMGGIGKSVMARALCDDPALQTAFPDGILWATLGQDAGESDMRARLRAWVETLGGVVGESAPTLEQLREALAALLEERACLLIVDDVWRRRDAEQFRVGGAGCRLLITTRDAEVAHALGLPVQPVPLMRQDEAEALLDHWSDGALIGADAALRRRIITDTLGRLPLAIRLSGAQLRSGDAEGWLAEFDARRLAARRPETPHDSLALTFGVSLDALPARDRGLYAALVIFREDEAISEVAIQRLWGGLGGIPARQCADLLTDLAARALVEIAEGADGRRAVIVHDLLRDFMRVELGDPAAAHRALLKAYAPRGGWHTLPDDGFLYDHLAYHLAGAGDHDGLRALFLSDDWLRARTAADGYIYDGYLRDLEVARVHVFEPRAEAAIEAADPDFTTLVDVIRATLIRATINSQASMHTRELIARAVQLHLPGWTAARALSITRHIMRANTRVTLYSLLMRTGALTDAEYASARDAALEAARSASDPVVRVDGIARLFQVIDAPTAEALHQEVLDALDAIRTTDGLVFAVSEYAPHAPQAVRDQVVRRALDGALILSQEAQRAEALSLLARFTPPDDQPRLLNAIDMIDNERFAVEVFEGLMIGLHPAHIARAHVTVEGFRYAGFRARARAALARILTPDHPLRAGLIGGARADALSVTDWWIAAGAIAAVAPFYDGEERAALIDRALSGVQRIPSLRSRLRAMTALAAALTPDDQRALAVFLEAGLHTDVDEETRADLLRALAGKLDRAGIRQVIHIAPRLEEVRWRARLLTAFAPHMDADLLLEALRVSDRIADDRAQVEAIIALCGVLPREEREPVLSEAIDRVRQIADPRQRAKALVPVIVALHGAQGARVLALIDELPPDASRLRPLIAAAENAREAQDIARIRHLAESVSDAVDRAEVLLGLWDHLNAGERQSVLAAVSQRREDRALRVRALLNLAREGAPEEAEALLQQALDAARTITGVSGRASALAQIGRVARSEALTAAVDEAFEAALKLRYDGSKASALVTLVPLLNEAQRAQIMPLAEATPDPWSRLWMLSGVLHNSSQPTQAQVEQARRSLYDYVRGRVRQKREAVLQFLSPRLIYSPPLMGRAAVAELARAVIAVCWRWEWT